MAHMKMDTINIPDFQQCCTVAIEGEVGHAHAHQFVTSLESIVKTGVKAVILDLSDVSYMNSSALAALIKLEDQLQEGFLALVGLQAKNRVVMDHLGITSLFSVFDTREKAMAVAREKVGVPMSQPEPSAPDQTPADPPEKAAEPAASPPRPIESTAVPSAIPVPSPDAQNLFHPTISIKGSVRHGNRIVIILNLHRERPESDDISDGVRLQELPSDYTV